MTRPARPGDICIVIRDADADGLNIGKQVSCDAQCTCFSTHWMVTFLEPFYVKRATLFDTIIVSRRPAGHCGCLPKPDIVPLIDPDGGDRSETPKPVEAPDGLVG